MPPWYEHRGVWRASCDSPLVGTTPNGLVEDSWVSRWKSDWLDTSPNEKEASGMAGVRLVVIYPQPRNTEAFEKGYTERHLPLAAKKIPHMTKFIAAKVLGTPSGEPAPFCRIAELHFPSMDVLRKAAGSSGAQEAISDAVALSTGGAPIFLVVEEGHQFRSKRILLVGTISLVCAALGALRSRLN